MSNKNKEILRNATLSVIKEYIETSYCCEIGWDRFRGCNSLYYNPGSCPIDEPFLIALAANCEMEGIKNVRLSIVRNAVDVVAWANPFDSMQEWLEALPQWDGVKRCERFLPDYLGTQDRPYDRAVGRYWWTAMVSRILFPGCKADMVPILVGKQGVGKTTLLETMAPSLEHYGDVRLSDRSSDLALKVLGKVIIGWEELRGIRGRLDADEVKTFITNRYVELRSRTKIGTDQHLRRFIIVGTTNRKDFLRDPSGHRRYLPFDVRSIDLGRVRTDKLQLWAEAFHTVVERDREGLSNIDFEEAEQLAALEHQHYINQARWVDDPSLMSMLETGSSRFSTEEALRRVGITAPTRGDRLEMRKTLEQLGMEFRSTYFRNLPHRPKTWQWPANARRDREVEPKLGNG